ncbi:hypothetical protein K0M31_003050 [Melipona bicolor]|uniref:Uncharacterized protein n=1 Tax=Melipona bicolor TaxID=60889 RepID=A0AA40KQ72_9HYME|nr:hypothetical protein K0M31_003050 [Melipona bicolor]
MSYSIGQHGRKGRGNGRTGLVDSDGNSTRATCNPRTRNRERDTRVTSLPQCVDSTGRAIGNIKHRRVVFPVGGEQRRLKYKGGQRRIWRTSALLFPPGSRRSEATEAD